jgi:hypothetical protein
MTFWRRGGWGPHAMVERSRRLRLIPEERFMPVDSLWE